MTIRRELPEKGAASDDVWGSDVIAAVLACLDVRYVALNPGASFRGLHDSLINYTGNTRPQMLLCLHEESAVAIAHGYAKASGRMMAVALHSNVGLLHGAMAIFNAWCDRVPILLLGATGPVDAAKRRPWIDWVHTVADQGALVRDFTKWDDQPASITAAAESVLRAAQLARTAPCAPVYVNFDAALQEQKLAALPPEPNPQRFQPAPPSAPDPAALARAVRLLAAARNPVILAGRVSRAPHDWQQRVALAECLGARVVTDLKQGAAFPTQHPLHVGPPGFFLSPAAKTVLARADVIVSLDWVDLAGTLIQASEGQPVAAQVIHASLDAHLHRGFGGESFGLPPIDVYFLTEPDAIVAPLLAALPKRAAAPSSGDMHHARGQSASGDLLTIRSIADALEAAAPAEALTLVRLPLGWPGDARDFHGPLDYLGYDGGAGIGSGPGMTVGAALALNEMGRMPVAILGDGDFLMGVTALWTAARYRIPLLIVVANNRSFYNDEVHQERVARERGRPVANKWIGQRIADPDIDLAALARAQGAQGIGPILDVSDLHAAMRAGLDAVRAGRVCVIDVRVAPARSDGGG